MKKRVLYAIAVMASLALSGTSCTTDKTATITSQSRQETSNSSLIPMTTSVNLPVLTLLRLQEENL